MTYAGIVVAAALIAVVLIDTFEVMILPRRIAHPFRLARLFYRSSWASWRVAAQLFPKGRRRNGFLSIFGPLSLFLLMAIWAAGLLVGFALLHWSLATPITEINPSDGTFTDYLYFSGTTLFTLGYGDLVPTSPLGRMLSVAEAGIGFGFLAIVISYLPVLYQAFSRREIVISLLDARAGSPPSAGIFVTRLRDVHARADIRPLLVEWERWSAELLESHLSYPVLRFYRSQHDNQSWVAALTTILDASAILIATGDESELRQAKLTFAMARHAAVDLALIAQTPAVAPPTDRLPADDAAHLYDLLHDAGFTLRDAATFAKALDELRRIYEPFVYAIAARLEFIFPAFFPEKPPVDNWQTSNWMPRSPGIAKLASAGTDDSHFD